MSEHIFANGADYSDIGDIKALQGRQLAQGTTKKGKAFNREINFGPGYAELARIVAGLGKEVKRINQCLTKEGAIEYAKKRRNWTAHEADITGANGKPDGIKEVFVCDNSGNVKVINGVGLAKSTYPTRKAYRTIYETKDARKETPYNQFMKELTEIHKGEFNEAGEPYYEADIAVLGDEFKNIRPEITPRQLYKQVVFQPVYDDMKQSLKDAGILPMTLAHIYNKALGTAFDNHVKSQVLADLLGADPASVEQKTVNKMLRSKDYKAASKELITKILQDENNEFSTCQSEIADLIDTTADEIVEGLQRVERSPRQSVASPFRTPRKA